MNTVSYGDPETTGGGGGWFVRESTDDGYPSVRIWILNRHDKTFRDPSPRYDAKCASCWLGHAHSQALHNEAMARREEAQQP